MALRYELRKMKTLLEGSRKTDPDESPSRNHSTEINSRTRLKSEPSQPSRLIANSGRLPGIESMLKKNLQAQNNDNSFIKKGTKIDSKTKDRNQITNESFLINGKSKHKPSLNGYGNPKFYLPGNPTFQEVHNQKPIRGTALNAKETTDKSPYQGQRETSNSMKPGSRQSTRAAALLFEKTLNQEYQFQFAGRNNPRLNSNLNLKPKKPTYFQKEAFSNSMNISGEGIFLDPSKNSSKKNGILEAYAANSNKGLVRNYNEDRVSIILNIVQPSTSNYQGEWPLCSFFGIYDGHGGSRCADFLKETLHKYVIGNKNFPENPIEALREAFKEAENDFIEMAQRNRQVEQSDNKCYIANVGDSRAVMSCKKGKEIIALSKDHKPGEESERNRIINNGGKVYQSQIGPPNKNLGWPEETEAQFGPPRVLPGRLSVSRTFGDIEAKLEKFGGNPLVVIAEPDIQVVTLDEDSDFIVMGCDGIFDRLENEDVVETVWNSAQQKCLNVHDQASQAVESVMIESLVKQTYDNVTVVMLAFAGFKEALKREEDARIIREIEMEKENVKEKEREKPKEPLDFYLAYDKRPKAKRSASNPRAKISFNYNQRESQESIETEKSTTNSSVDEALSVNRFKQKLSPFVGEPTLKDKNYSASKHLVKAYKKMNFFPLVK